MKIAIDAGHGSNTAGKRTPPLPYDIEVDGEHFEAGEQYREHYANVGVCVRLNAALRRCGFDTLRVSWNDDNSKDDDNVTLSARQAMIKAAGCELSVSIHFNAVGYGESFSDAAGVLTYIHSNGNQDGDSRALAEKVQSHLAGGTAQRNRGVVTGALAMCNCAAMSTRASILCELAFMTNLHEATTMMTNPDFWEECAEEICRGICDYTGVAYVDNNANLDNTPADWEKSAVEKALAQGVITGDEHGNLKLHDPPMNLARALVLFEKMGLL